MFAEEEIKSSDEQTVSEDNETTDMAEKAEGNLADATNTKEAEAQLTEEEIEEPTETAKEESEKTSASQEKPKKKGLFDKKDKTDLKDEQIAELTDQKQRLMAEFDNFRKRTEKEKAAMFEIGAKSVIEKLLPIVDNFERGLASVSDEERESSFANGMDMIYKQLLKMLSDMDVVAISAVGEQFDPNLHNAVMHIDDENYGENVIVQELQRGYTYRGTVVRHSMVQVAN